MTEQQIIETLATMVMGWEEISSWSWIEREAGRKIYKGAWNPLQNIADAWQVVEKFDDYKVGKDWCRLYRDDEDWFVWGFETSQKAICMAALKSVA
ncbi:BC1872 family protein [Brevibacillus centrosporus]|uniref:BC1872 family protein n=1 Tax=Brevibacillus centrosporus TaxID=54910 RepID=UPI002E2080AB|nr:hypothetical protein [Brevibacillus centrosporus]